HVVSVARGFSSPKAGDAKLLTDPLELTHGGNPYWEEWSKKQATKAGRLWPIVQKLAQNEIYVLIPGLLELAQKDSTDAEFSQQVDAYLKSEYTSLIHDMISANKAGVAQGLYDEITELFPGDPAWADLQERLEQLQ
ncbi:MAG: hypothetical protein AAGA03_08415, partial [Planctomycetota bacterium]